MSDEHSPENSNAEETAEASPQQDQAMSNATNTPYEPHTPEDDTSAIPMIGHISAKNIAEEIQTLEEFFPKDIEKVLIKAAIDYYLLEDRVNSLKMFEDYLDQLETLAPESADKKTEYENQCDENGNYKPLVAAEKRFKEMWDIKFPQQQGQYPTVSRATVSNPYIRLENVVSTVINYTEEQSERMVSHVKDALLSADPVVVEKSRNGFVDQLMALKKHLAKLEKQTQQSGFWKKTIAMNQEVHMKYLTNQGLTEDYQNKTKEILNHGRR